MPGDLGRAGRWRNPPPGARPDRARNTGSASTAQAVYSASVVLQRGGIGLVAVVVAGMSALGCGGPIDSRPPSVRPDAGIDRGTGGIRIIDPLGMGGYPGFDAAPDVSWPFIPGCISGQPPSPQFSSDHIDPINVGCASSTTLILTEKDAANQGMVLIPSFDPPVDGLDLYYNSTVCANNQYPIEVIVRQSAFRPGPPITTSLSIALSGPPPQQKWVFPVTVNPLAIDFSVDPAIIDFGTVNAGQFVQIPISVTNSFDGAPFDHMYASQSSQGPFQLYSTPGPGGPSVIPGETRPMFQAILSTRMTGTFDATFLVSPFQPGVAIDPACGAIRTITMHAQIVSGGPPPPLPP
jgi:hypothetical protein